MFMRMKPWGTNLIPDFPGLDNFLHSKFEVWSSSESPKPQKAAVVPLMLGIGYCRGSEDQTQNSCADEADSFRLVVFISSAVGALTLSLLVYDSPQYPLWE